MTGAKSVEMSINDMTFACRIAGDKDTGTPVLLLHGFPETSHIWLDLMTALSANGYFCVAPNQRGYSKGARPEKVAAYGLRHLSEDVVGLAQAFGFERFHLIGHDWGAIISWSMLTLFPEHVKSFVSLSTPHVTALFEAIHKDPEQKKMSRYLRVFQLPVLPELLLTMNRAKILRNKWSASSAEQIEDFLSVFGNRAGTRAALHYYRANKKELRGLSDFDFFKDAHHPTLLIWGNQDESVGRVSVNWSRAHMKGPFKLVELNAGHWLPTEAEEQVLEHVLLHLRDND